MHETHTVRHSVHKQQPPLALVSRSCMKLVFAGTYVAHPWRLRNAETKEIITEYCGHGATIEVTVAGNVIVHPGDARHVWAGSQSWPPEWGTYQQRSEVLGIPIMVRVLVLFVLGSPAP